jgi:hypothetical protein
MGAEVEVYGTVLAMFLFLFFTPVMSAHFDASDVINSTVHKIDDSLIF